MLDLDIKNVHPLWFRSYMMSPWTVYLTPPCSQICLNQIAGPRHIAHCTGLGPSLHSSSTITKIQLNTNQTAGGGGVIIKTIYATGQNHSYNHQYHIGTLTIIILNASSKLYPTLIICFISHNIYVQQSLSTS
jgi:hypothetical protein